MNIWPNDHLADQIKQSAANRGYPEPIIVEHPEHGYLMAKCPECGKVKLLRGYNMHITREHRPNNYKSRKGIKYGTYNVRNRKIIYPETDPSGRYTDEQWRELIDMGAVKEDGTVIE